MKVRHFVVAIPGIFVAISAMAAGNHKVGHDAEAIGKPGAAAKVTRTITVDMKDDLRFHASNFDVKQGETIRFIVKNSGQLKHEMVLGTAKGLKEHDEVMKKNPKMEHADANMVTVAPGKTGEIIWQFTKAGKVDFACLQPGHYDAGMKGVVTVAGSSSVEKTPVKTENTQQATNTKTDGEIRKVDMDNKKVTIKHGEIKNLDMPGMTMVFQVKDAAMLDKVKAGDKVRFKAEKAGGAVMVTDIELVK